MKHYSIGHHMPDDIYHGTGRSFRVENSNNKADEQMIEIEKALERMQINMTLFETNLILNRAHT